MSLFISQMDGWSPPPSRSKGRCWGSSWSVDVALVAFECGALTGTWTEHITGEGYVHIARRDGAHVRHIPCAHRFGATPPLSECSACDGKDKAFASAPVVCGVPAPVVECIAPAPAAAAASDALIVAPGHRDSIRNMITGALQADRVHITVPADGNSITVIAIDGNKAGEIQGQRQDNISRLNTLRAVKQICIPTDVSAKTDSVASPHQGGILRQPGGQH